MDSDDFKDYLRLLAIFIILIVLRGASSVDWPKLMQKVGVPMKVEGKP